MFGQVEGAFVFGADGRVEQAAVAQAHLGAGVPEQRHQGLQGDAGVDQRGGVGVPQLVGGDMAQAGDAGGVVELTADALLREPAAVAGEQELPRPAVARVWQGAARGSQCGDLVNHDEGFVVKRDHPFGVHLPQRDLQPGPVAVDLVHAVQLEIQEFPDP